MSSFRYQRKYSKKSFNGKIFINSLIKHIKLKSMTLKKLLPILNRLINYYSDLLYTVLDKSLINGNSMVFGRSDKIGTISIIFILAGRDLQTVSLKNDYSRSIGMITLETIILNYKDLIKKAYK